MGSDGQAQPRHSKQRQQGVLVVELPLRRIAQRFVAAQKRDKKIRMRREEEEKEEEEEEEEEEEARTLG